MNGLDALKEKAAALRAWIGDRDESVKRLEAERDEDHANHAGSVTAAESKVSVAESEQARHIAGAEILESEADTLLIRAEADATRLRQSAKARRTEATGAETDAAAARVHVADVKRLKRAVEERWRTKLATLQDGELRRKTAQLEKLERRIAQAVETAARASVDIGFGHGLPETYGTPAPAPTMKAREVKVP